jgi:hypothetical protein
MGEEKSLSELTIDQFNAIREQIEREKVAPKFDEWRKHYAYKIAHGGRGAGAKTSSAMSLAIQFGECPGYFGEKVNVMITREVQNTLDISSYSTIVRMIKKLGYRGWRVTKTYIENTKNGSKFMFRGLNDIVADNYRSLDDIDILIMEEAHNMGYKTLETVLPSMRKKGCEVWVLFNRVQECDPVYDVFVKHERPNSCILTLRPGQLDNPWFNNSELPEKRDADYARDPEEAIHIWEGMPRSQGDKAVFSLTDIKAACTREVPEEGVEEIGVDVARYGHDDSVIVRRHGLKVIKMDSVHGFDTVAVASRVWEIADKRYDIIIKVDGGYNPGVIDLLRSWGANVLEVNFGGRDVSDKEKYVTIADELWFSFPIKEVQIPDDEFLKAELAGRHYTYDTAGRKRVEAKDIYKKRNGGKSPDRADGLLLAFFKPRGIVSNKVREDMAALRRR